MMFISQIAYRELASVFDNMESMSLVILTETNSMETGKGPGEESSRENKKREAGGNEYRQHF